MSIRPINPEKSKWVIDYYPAGKNNLNYWVYRKYKKCKTAMTVEEAGA